MGYFGKGVTVCAIDDGVDYKNPRKSAEYSFIFISHQLFETVLGGCFGKGCKVAIGAGR